MILCTTIGLGPTVHSFLGISPERLNESKQEFGTMGFRPLPIFYDVGAYYKKSKFNGLAIDP